MQSEALFVLVYVEDILVTGSNPKLLQSFLHDLDTFFALKTLGSVNYFLGLKLIVILQAYMCVSINRLLICYKKLAWTIVNLVQHCLL